jgi:hypothetical protein
MWQWDRTLVGSLPAAGLTNWAKAQSSVHSLLSILSGLFSTSSKKWFYQGRKTLICNYRNVMFCGYNPYKTMTEDA